MAGLVPAISILGAPLCQDHRDARGNPTHDEGSGMLEIQRGQKTTSPTATHEAMLTQARTMAPRFAARAAAAEEARRLPAESAKEMLDAGFARILLPREIGGFGLGFDTWIEAVREISKADASHGWCASIIIHHAHMIAQFPETAQQLVWRDGLDVSMAASFMPNVQAVPVEGGYRLSGKGSPFASGVDHSTWVMLGGLAPGGTGGGAPEMTFFLVGPGGYTVQDSWFTTGMRATGSKTVVVDNVVVPRACALRLTDLRDGNTPGGARHADAIFHMPFFYYAPLAFATPVVGAAQGAYAHFRDWTKTRKGPDGSSLAEKTNLQVQMARVAADIDAADLLLRRAVHVVDAPEAYSPALLARSVRDFARIAELCVSAVDTLIGLSGTAGFASSHPLQRAWRDIHFMAMHVCMNIETNLSHFGRMELGLGSDGKRPWF
jgi:3-hydroxy-9,10-secoandrosta-1,3,5(10)-triene-9,17-dione monooxygenase